MVKTTILVKVTLFWTGFNIRETKMDQRSIFFGASQWPEEVHFGSLGPPTVLRRPLYLPCDRKLLHFKFWKPFLVKFSVTAMQRIAKLIPFRNFECNVV